MRGRRHVVGVDRTLLTLVGLALVAGGAMLVAVRAGWLPAVAPPDAVVDVSGATAAVAETWWAGACAVAALVLVALGLWWLLAHRPGPRTAVLTLPGSRSGDRLRVAPDAVTRAATADVEADPQVRSASLGLRQERGALVLTGRVRAAPRADVAALGALVDETTRRTAQVLSREVAGRVHLSVARRGSAERRLD